MRMGWMGVFSSDGVIPTSLTPETSSPTRAESVFSLCRAEQREYVPVSSSSLSEKLTDRATSQSWCYCTTCRLAATSSGCWIRSGCVKHRSSYGKVSAAPNIYCGRERKRHNWWIISLFCVNLGIYCISDRFRRGSKRCSCLHPLIS